MRHQPSTTQISFKIFILRAEDFFNKINTLSSSTIILNQIRKAFLCYITKLVYDKTSKI